MKYLDIFPQIIRLKNNNWYINWHDSVGYKVAKNSYDFAESIFINSTLKSGMLVVDVGAHHGYYSLLFSFLVGSNGSVLAFEPSDRERRRLKLNLTLNRIKNVKVFDCALSQREGKHDFWVRQDRETGYNTLLMPKSSTNWKKIMVPTKTLDSVFSENNYDRLGLIKIDTEGTELEVLKGARKVIERYNPIIMVEMNDTRVQPLKQIYLFLRQKKYIWCQLTDDGKVRFINFSKSFYENLIAIPQ